MEYAELTATVQHDQVWFEVCMFTA